MPTPASPDRPRGLSGSVGLFLEHTPCASSAPAFAQTGDDYRDLDAATEALFAAQAVEAGPGHPVPQAVEAETPLSHARAEALAARQGVNFAGRHVLTVIGCGSECQAAYVLNPAPGDRFANVVSGLGVDFRADSALLIVNPPRELTYFGADPVPERLRPRCLVYAQGRFGDIDCEGYPR